MTITLGIIGILVMAVSGYSQDLADPAKLQPRRAEERALERILRTSSKPKSAEEVVRALGRMSDEETSEEEHLRLAREAREADYEFEEWRHEPRRFPPPEIDDSCPF
jgi:hypothetical protein